MRPATSAEELDSARVAVVRGDLVDHGSLPAAVEGIDTVLVTATAIARRLADASTGVMMDTTPARWDDGPLRARGIAGRTATAWIESFASASPNGPAGPGPWRAQTWLTSSTRRSPSRRNPTLS